MTSLRDSDHPYYCSDANYYTTPDKTIMRYDSWDEFHDDWKNFDVDMNLIFRWDWNVWEDGVEELSIYRMLQRKGAFVTQIVRVTPDDEDAVRSYLQPHLDRLVENWEPMTPGDDR